MADYAEEMRAAQAAQREVARLDAAYEARGKAVARAWAARPGGVTWAEFTAAFNEGLPKAARLRVSALRLDEINHREPAAVEA